MSAVIDIRRDLASPLEEMARQARIGTESELLVEAVSLRDRITDPTRAMRSFRIGLDDLIEELQHAIEEDEMENAEVRP